MSKNIKKNTFKKCVIAFPIEISKYENVNTNFIQNKQTHPKHKTESKLQVLWQQIILLPPYHEGPCAEVFSGGSRF